MSQLFETIQHLYNHAPAFRRRMESANLSPTDIQTEDDLAKLPVLRKDDVIALQKNDPPFGGLLAAPIGSLRRVFQSPGPINEPEPNLPDPGRWAVALKAAGFQPGELVINCFGYHMTPAGASLEEGLRHIGCVPIPGGIGNQEQQVQMMSSFRVTGYVGLPSYLNALLGKAEVLSQPLYLQRAFVLAEPLPPSLRKSLNDHGIDVYQGYGTAECGNLGYDCSQLDGWHIPENTIVQICDINSGKPLPHGQTGEVVVTLFNRHYALVRFGVGDLSSILAEPCACGRPGLRLNGWQGRVGAATKVRGMFLHPTQLAGMMARFPVVSAYQAVITRKDHRDKLTLEVVLKDGVEATAVTQSLQATARQALKFKLDVVAVVPSLPPDAPPILDQRTWD
ncbi:MAG: phenylacetate--CoA ligase family protein [Anaerolineae bacterium]